MLFVKYKIIERIKYCQSYIVNYLLCILTMTFFNCNAYSQNLVSNGSFEDENICTEYTKNCAPEAWICSSLTANYYFDIGSWAFEGKHFVGLIAGSNRKASVRSFIRSRLLCGLRKGNQYRLSFYLRSRHNIFDSTAIYFSPNDFLFEKRSYRQISPSLTVKDSSEILVENNFQWKKFSFVYTATGEENYITIGSFKKQEYHFTFPPEINGSYYLYLDSVSFVPANPYELLCNSADSMKAKIYEENERHYLLEKKLSYYRKNAPAATVPPITILQNIDTLIIPDILFATASARLNEKSFIVLDSFCVALAGRNIDSIIVEGHTDSVGTLMYNTKLSADRATAVSDYIHRKSVRPENKIVVHHFAYSRPVASNQTSQGRQRNRRVEIYLYTHQ